MVMTSADHLQCRGVVFKQPSDALFLQKSIDCKFKSRGSANMSSINYTALDAAQVASPATPQAHLITHLSSGAEPTHKKLGILMSIWNLINDVIAAGAVALPFLVASGGVFLTPILMALYCFLCFQSLLLVFELVSRYKVESFPELAQRGLGRAGFVWASACMFIFNWCVTSHRYLSNTFVYHILCVNRGGAVGALIAIGTAVPDLMVNWFPHSTSFWTSRSGIIIGAMCLFGPLSLFKSMRRFAPLSMIGVWAIFGLAFCIIGRCVLTYTHAVDAWPVPTPPVHAWRFYQSSFFPAIGGISYIFTCHDMSIHVLHRYHSLLFQLIVS
jgi:amino acid permease